MAIPGIPGPVEGQTQTGIIQTNGSPTGSLPLAVSHSIPVPEPAAHHVLVRVLAVALNHCDHKMVSHFNNPGSLIGSDFCGVVVTAAKEEPDFKPGTRVCGNTFPYNPARQMDGPFAQYVSADARQLVRPPPQWSDIEAAALGGVGWKTAALSLWDPNALGLEGRPSKPVQGEIPVLVYGGATATGTMTCQLLKLSGYTPIAITSPDSASLVKEYLAAGHASYLSQTAARDAQHAADGALIRHAVDCITDADSAEICFTALARRGGRYVGLEAFEEAWHTRRAVHVFIVMAYETFGLNVELGPNTYTRKANPALQQLGHEAAAEVQALLDQGLLKHHPIREVDGSWEGIVKGLEELRAGKVKGAKLVLRIPRE